MKTKIILSLLGLMTVSGIATAQNTAGGAAPSSTPAPAVVEAEVVPLIVFEDTPRDDVIKTLARQAGINFIFDPRVTSAAVGPNGQPVPSPSISIRFENVTAQAALEAILANHSLQLIEDPKTKIARITVKDAAVVEPLVTKVFQLEFAAPSELAIVLKPAISARGSIIADKRTSQLMIVATAKELEAIEDLVKKLDSPTKQVLIESQIYSTSKTPESVKGINWASTLSAQNVSFGNGTAGAAGFTDGAKNGGTVSGSIVPGAGNLTLNTGNGFFPNIAFLNADGVKAVLSFFNTDGESKLVSTPRAVAMDNQNAILSATKAQPIITVTPGTQNSPAGVTISYTNIGTILNVTPRITANSNVVLKITTEVSKQDAPISRLVDGNAYTADVFDIQKIDTQVMVPNGNTLVMGGLIKDSSTKAVGRVPGISKVPVLGWAFKHDKSTKDQQHLLIFITPSIVEDFDFQYTPSEFLRNKPDYQPVIQNIEEPTKEKKKN